MCHSLAYFLRLILPLPDAQSGTARIRIKLRRIHALYLSRSCPKLPGIKKVFPTNSWIEILKVWISDILAGFFIIFEGQFKAGDYIEIDEAQGNVEAISLRTTSILSPDGQLHILRNGKINKVINYSKLMSTRWWILG